MSKANTPCPPNSTAVLGGDLDQLHRAFRWAFHNNLFTKIPRHGNISWTVAEFVLQAILWVWSDAATLANAFAHAKQLCGKLLGKFVHTSYTGFADALTTWTPKLMPRLRERLHDCMARVAKTHWRIGSWLPMAVDGSRTTTPRTKKNERAFAARRYGHGKRAQSRKKWKNKRRRSKKLSHPVAPQIWLTLLWHIGLRMPWSWRLGPSNSSERQHLADLIKTEEFPDKTLFCGDAGFVGYDLWQTIADRGHHFLIRVGSNIRLLRKLGDVKLHDGLVHFWPKSAVAAKQPPMVLRLLTFQTGKCQVHAVTNVLSENDLSLSAAGEIYAKRWGVEVQFRSLKQTFGRSKLHSGTPQRAYAELEWSLLGLWLIQLLTAAEQIPKGVGPDCTSVSVAVQVFRDAMRHGLVQKLRTQLRGAVKDKYKRRDKRARYRPQKKDKPSAGEPKVVSASAELRRKYRLLTT